MRAGTDGSAQSANQLSASRRKRAQQALQQREKKLAEKLWNSTVLTHGTKLNQHQLGGEGKKKERKEAAKDQQKCFLCKTKKGENPQQKNPKLQTASDVRYCKYSYHSAGK